MPITRAQAAGTAQSNGNGAAKADAGVKRASSTRQKAPGGTKRAKKGEGGDVSASKPANGATKNEEATDDGAKDGTDEATKDEKMGEAAPPDEEKDGAKTSENGETGVSKSAQTQTGPQPEGFEKGSGILERGHIYFFYRPKVELDEASSLDDVSKFFILLLPRPASPSPNSTAAPGAEAQLQPHKPYRYISVGKKRLPDPRAKREVFWAAVLSSGSDMAGLSSELGPKTYDTKTRGTRHVAPSRLAGRGSYAIHVRTAGPPSAHATHLAYYLSHPAEPGAVQAALDILPSGSFVLQVRNPTAPASASASAPGGAQAGQAGLDPSKKADYPREVLEGAFGGGADGKGDGLRFVPANPVRLLDYKGAEILLIADKTDVGDVVGDQAAAELEKSAEKDTERLDSEQVMNELMMDATEFPAEALEGEWA